MNRITQFLITFTLLCTSTSAFAIDAPSLSISTSGTDVIASWSSVTGATGYTLHYAPNPFLGVHTIIQADMGTDTNFSATLWTGASYYVTITSRDASSESEYSNVELFTIDNSLGRDTQTAVITVTSAGQVWMDRNLGATQIATSSTDEEAYGDLYQWGRSSDGHEKRTSSLTSTLASSYSPGHGDFVTSNSYDNDKDWQLTPNDNLWQGGNGINNPCPVGFRLPTSDEWRIEMESWSLRDSDGAFNSPLKLVVAGARQYSDGTIADTDSYGHYWSSTPRNGYTAGFAFGRNVATIPSYGYIRASGYSIRCIQD